MHLAGFKLRRWRETHDPPLSADQFGARYGLPNPWPSRTVYGWEAKGQNCPRLGPRNAWPSWAFATQRTGSNRHPHLDIPTRKAQPA